MPQVFKMGSYWIYFWANENKPTEPIHVHVYEGAPSPNATKIWITSAGECVVANNNSKIPTHVLKNITETIASRSDEIIQQWKDFFGEIEFFC